jgi:hypothetical protein
MAERTQWLRSNRKRNQSTPRRDAGRQIAINVGGVGEVEFHIPKFPEEKLKFLAAADWDRYHDPAFRRKYRKTTAERKCFDYLRHHQSDYKSLQRRTYGAAYLALIRAFADAVIEEYEWLRDECESYCKRKASLKQHNIFRIIKRPDSLSAQQAADFNAKEEIKPEAPITEEEEVPRFFEQLGSLDQSRFMYLPPFLRPEEVKARRFGENPNDRWWEWEEELGLMSDLGRPKEFNGDLEFFRRSLKRREGKTMNNNSRSAYSRGRQHD